MTRIPVVFILGATGTGKSRLALLIAKKFNGEIISADSMQVYKKLDIASNKVSLNERSEVHHHMLDILGPMDRYTVTDYRNQVLPIINDILKRGKLPVVVGGTTYYIESLIWNNLLIEKPEERTPELVYQRYEVINNPSDINKWITYEATVVPQTENKMYIKGRRRRWGYCTKKILNTINETKTTEEKTEEYLNNNENVVELSNKIDYLKLSFLNSVQEITKCMKIPLKYYKHTFYRWSVEESINDFVTEAESIKLENEFFDIIHIESNLLNNYLYQCLQQSLLFLNNIIINSTDLNLIGNKTLGEDIKQNIMNNLYQFSMLPPSRFWNLQTLNKALKDFLFNNDNSEELVNKFLKLNELHSHLSFAIFFMLKNILHYFNTAINTRKKRLTLVRIIDDENMIDFDNDTLFSELLLIDPEFSKDVHPNNRRKVIRILQVYFKTGNTMTQIYQKQSRDSDNCMRFPDACIFWLCCDADVLCARLDKRVDEMIKLGLINELTAFHEQYNVDRLKYNVSPEYSKGIFQSIGLKEFHSYLMLDKNERFSKKGQEMLRKGIENMKIQTKQYAKYQIRYILNRFIKVPDNKKVPTIFKLDCTNEELWLNNVELKSISIVKDYLDGKDFHDMKFSSICRENPDPDRFKGGDYYCSSCERRFVGLYQWQIHCKSKSHHKRVYKMKVRELRNKLSSINKSSNNNNTSTANNINRC